jgi:hypothetical protein
LSRGMRTFVPQPIETHHAIRAFFHRRCRPCMRPASARPCWRSGRKTG